MRWMSRRKHNLGSCKVGEPVEFAGKDIRKRGMGIVLKECNCFGDEPGEFKGLANMETEFQYVEVYWQNLDEKEILHKAYLRKTPLVEKGILK